MGGGRGIYGESGSYFESNESREFVHNPTKSTAKTLYNRYYKVTPCKEKN